MDDAINETIVTALNSTLGQLDSKAVAYSDDACTPKYFVFNSQVTQTLPATGRESFLTSEVGILTEFFTFHHQTVYAVPILTFAFVCHPAILPMYEELKE